MERLPSCTEVRISHCRETTADRAVFRDIGLLLCRAVAIRPGAVLILDDRWQRVISNTKAAVGRLWCSPVGKHRAHGCHRIGGGSLGGVGSVESVESVVALVSAGAADVSVVMVVVVSVGAVVVWLVVEWVSDGWTVWCIVVVSAALVNDTGSALLAGCGISPPRR